MEKADIIVVVTRISLSLAIFAKLMNKKIIFLDAMCDDVPERFIKRISTKAAILLSNSCICLSRTQAELWSQELGLSTNKFTPVKFGVDTSFYQKVVNPSEVVNTIEKPCMIAVGRDSYRNFDILDDVTRELGWRLILVTQSYLVTDKLRTNPNIMILDNISYDELFSLYRAAEVAIVPLKRCTTHMSGIRATIEAMLQGTNVIASRSPGMNEYFEDGFDLLYYEPENKDDLIEKIKLISQNREYKYKLAQNASEKVTKSFNVEQYADSLEEILSAI